MKYIFIVLSLITANVYLYPHNIAETNGLLMYGNNSAAIAGLDGLIQSEDDSVIVDKMPVPIGGMNAIYAKLHYPKSARQMGIEGKIYVLAYINEKGGVDRVNIIRGVSTILDTVVCNVVRQVKFTPGMQKGKPVKAQVAIPIEFNLN